MIKIFCDFCSKEAPMDGNFMFEAQIQELKEAVDMRTMNTAKQVVKSMIQLCQLCYDKKIVPLLKK